MTNPATPRKRSNPPGSEFAGVWRYPGKRATVWRIRYRDASGRRILETLGKEPEWTRKRAEAELRRRLVDVERDGYTAPDRVTFAQFTDRWLTEYLPGRGLKLTTTDGYQQALRNHLLPALGHLTLQELERRPEHLDHYITRKTREGLSPKTITNQLLVLQAMLKTAVRWRLMHHNPVRDIERPRYAQPELNILTPEEISRLTTAYRQLETESESEEDRAWWRLAHTITLVALGTAMRRGELLALHWHDIELLEGRLRVRQALVKGRFTTPKSRAGNRTIHLGPRTLGLLADHWAASAFQGDDELVFCHPQLGTPLDPAKISREYMKPALLNTGITKAVRPFHDLRHTALTHEAAAGNPLTYIQMKAGHSQIAITERYIHAAQTSFPGAVLAAERRIFGG